MPDDHIGSEPADVVELGGIELEPATLAAPLAQRRSADAVTFGPDLLVQRHQFGRDLCGDRGSFGAQRLGLGVDGCPRGVASLLDLLCLAADGVALGGQGLGLALGLLDALHDLELGVFEHPLAPFERGDLTLQVLQLFWRGHLAGVESLLVAGFACPHLLDIGVGALLLALEVGDGGGGYDLGIAQPGVLGGQLLELSRFRKRGASVRQLVELLICCLNIEQAQLGSRVNVQGWLPSSATDAPGSRADSCRVHGSVGVAET